MCQLKSNKSTEHLNLTSTEIGKIVRLENTIVLHLQFRVGGRTAIFLLLLNIQKLEGRGKLLGSVGLPQLYHFFFRPNSLIDYYAVHIFSTFITSKISQPTFLAAINQKLHYK